VGTFAIQLAKHIGATVATTTSTANAELVRALGADVVVDYKKENFEKVLSGYDVVLNSLDGDTLRKSLSVLKPGGKLISISGPPDPDFCQGDWRKLVPATNHAPIELRHSEEGQASSRQLFIPVHARERRAVERDHIADRSRHHSPRHGSGLPIRSDQRSLGLHRDWTVEGQSRGQGEVKRVLRSPGSKEQRRGASLSRISEETIVKTCRKPAR
jgi:Zinc-binding dehydrogenase